MDSMELRDIPGYVGLYQVNRQGDIYSLRTDRFLKYSVSADGYKQYNLHKDKKAFLMTAHKAVALAFIPNPNNYPLVNHKDENKMNCSVENLEWCDHKYNSNYNGANIRMAKYSIEKFGKEFFVYDANLNYIGKFKGTRKFARDHGISSGQFSATLSHNTTNPDNLRSCKGYYPVLEMIET